MTEYEQTTIEAFHARHGNIYDYSKVTCRKKQDKITIGCPTHGYFTQTVKHHARGDGCPQCFPSKRGNNRRMSQEEYVQKCKVAHNNKFDYSKTVYTGGQNSVIIICPIHGEFTQNAGTHASGSGCFRCGRLLIAKGSLKNTDYFISAIVENLGV